MKTLNVVKQVKGKKQEGATMIEYAVIAAIIVIAVITALTTLGTDIAGAFGDVSAEINKP